MSRYRVAYPKVRSTGYLEERIPQASGPVTGTAKPSYLTVSWRPQYLQSSLQIYSLTYRMGCTVLRDDRTMLPSDILAALERYVYRIVPVPSRITIWRYRQSEAANIATRCVPEGPAGFGLYHCSILLSNAVLPLIVNYPLMSPSTEYATMNRHGIKGNALRKYLIIGLNEP